MLLFLLDFMGEPQFQNWLESHEAVVNSRWVVTTATRTREPGTYSLLSNISRTREISNIATQYSCTRRKNQ